ncbi:DUF3987 domain-containing protein [Polymorphobacter fuscus]|uniref:DUF3987 domain-containing protein n=1 Tax=Sandarakinorhabdus fusca TaxID=1439888 RepID=A0A7C9GPZ4_9SPHN|nr:DUF3987 domain-containing protein [Polymorphobacter fuscus]KAB7645548.1 DUF3987 domain-containing protein [Polymorphobacter fuscus]MQT17992.1 DUF3987 domain-containing protein [Polymorphobacter fuscus]NJC08620.1 putative DNA primase/helicase [Polymorphobacter fuscus]
MSNAAARAFEAAAPVNPVPDMSVLSAGRREPPAFPTDLFSERLWQIAREYADGAGAPVDYVASAMLSVAAATIGGARKVQPFRGVSWYESSILWIGAVGDPSSNKSPALGAIVEPLRDIERDLAPGYADDLRRWETDELTAKLEHDAWAATVKDANKCGHSVPVMPQSAVAPAKPQRPRLMTQDATPEGIAAIMFTNRRLVCYRDELTGWFQSFERYSPGGRTQWLEAYGGRPLVVDRKGADAPLVIPFNGVSVLGGIQPDKLGSIVLAGDDDGLAARFLWVWPRPMPQKRPRPHSDESLWPVMLRRLVALPMSVSESGHPCSLILPLDDDAADAFDRWTAANKACAHDGGALYKGFVGKLTGAVLRIAMVLQMLDWAEWGGPEPQSIALCHVATACTFADSYAKPMALRVFGDAVLPLPERNAATMARWIVDNQSRSINLSALRRLKLPGLRDEAAIDAATKVLVDADWLTFTGQRAGDTPGRAPKNYMVNPLVHTLDRGAQE